MSVHVASAVYLAKLGSAARKAVALKLADHSNDDGTNVYPSVGRVARELEIADRTVQRILKQFVAEGLLVVEELGGKGPRSTTHYRFDLQKLSALPRTSAKGDIKSSLTKTSRVTPTTAKGDTDDRKGDTVSPEPSITIISEPSERERAVAEDDLQKAETAKPMRPAKPQRKSGEHGVVDRAVEAYNCTAERQGFSICKLVTPARRRRLGQRLEDIGGMENFQRALSAIPTNDWLMGRVRKEGHKPFRLDLDYLMQTDGKSGDVLAKLLDKAAEVERHQTDQFANEWLRAFTRHMLDGLDWEPPQWTAEFVPPWPNAEPMTMEEAHARLRANPVWANLLNAYANGSGDEVEFNRIRLEMFDEGKRERIEANRKAVLERKREEQAREREAARGAREAREREEREKEPERKAKEAARIARQEAFEERFRKREAEMRRRCSGISTEPLQN